VFGDKLSNKVGEVRFPKEIHSSLARAKHQSIFGAGALRLAGSMLMACAFRSGVGSTDPCCRDAKISGSQLEVDPADKLRQAKPSTKFRQRQ
jgi:hypothetical protein